MNERLNELSPAMKAAIVNGLGFCLLLILTISYTYLPLESFAFGVLNRIWKGLIAAIAFGLVAINFILTIDWVTPKDWFELNEDMAKAVIIASCIVGMCVAWAVG